MSDVQLEATPVLYDPADIPDADLVDWGVIPTMIDGESRVSGVLLYKGPGGSPESGVWVCTPGYWACEVTEHEFCHFLSGRATYTHESGEVIEIEPDTAAFFPKGWKGTCRGHVYPGCATAPISSRRPRTVGWTCCARPMS